MSLKVHKLAATSDVIALRNYGPGHLMALNLHMSHGQSIVSCVLMGIQPVASCVTCVKKQIRLFQTTDVKAGVG